ncbi:hypothetical protein OSTOST_08317 [Ostertagia ostertagi]
MSGEWNTDKSEHIGKNQIRKGENLQLDTKNPFNRFSDPYDWEFEQSLQSFQDESKLKRIVTSPDGTPVTRSVSGTPASMSRGAVGRFPPTMRHVSMNRPTKNTFKYS